MSNPYDYPNHYRETELVELFTNLIRGNSCCIVGVGTVGKTHLIEHFSENNDAQSYILSLIPETDFTPEDFLFVRIDPNAMLHIETDTNVSIPASWPGFELIFRRLLERVMLIEGDAAHEKDSLYKFTSNSYAKIAPSRGPIMAYGLLESSVTAVIRELLPPNGRIVFVIDEFEKLLDLPDGFFRNLRALRDLHRYNLVFVVASRDDVSSIVPADRWSALEPFIDLFQKPIYLGLSQTEDDTEILFKYLHYRFMSDEKTWKKTARERLFALTGGHSGLMRTCFSFHGTFEQYGGEKLVQQLLYESSVVKECNIIFKSISLVEQELLASIADDQETRIESYSNMVSLQKLRDKGLVSFVANSLEIQPKIFAYYMRGRSQGLFNKSDN